MQLETLQDLYGTARTYAEMLGDNEAAKSAGFDCHLVKPVDPAKIDQLLAEFIEEIRRAHPAERSR